MHDLASDHYETLGLERRASAAQIRAAYLRLVREHTPENDPDQFKLISEAYRILSNAEKRREYDKEERLPADVESELRRISDLTDSEVVQALCDLRQLAKRHPQYRILRFRLGILLDHEERHREAAGIFQALYDEQPDNPSYATWLGDALLHCHDERRGLDYLREAIVLDKHHSDAYICMARHYTDHEEYQQASEILERGIQADGTVDVQDIPLFMQQIVVLARQEDWYGMDALSRRVTTALAEEDEETRQFASGYLGSLTVAFNEARRPDLTKYVLDIQRALDPENEKLAEISEEISEAARMWKERPKLTKDTTVPDWIKAFVYSLTFDEGSEHDRNTFFMNLAAMVAERGSAMESEWSRARGRYPALLGPLTTNWRKLREVGDNARQQLVVQQHGGCLVLIAILLAMAVGAAAI